MRSKAASERVFECLNVYSQKHHHRVNTTKCFTEKRCKINAIFLPNFPKCTHNLMHVLNLGEMSRLNADCTKQNSISQVSEILNAQQSRLTQAGVSLSPAKIGKTSRFLRGKNDPSTAECGAKWATRKKVIIYICD